MQDCDAVFGHWTGDYGDGAIPKGLKSESRCGGGTVQLPCGIQLGHRSCERGFYLSGQSQSWLVDELTIAGQRKFEQVFEDRGSSLGRIGGPRTGSLVSEGLRVLSCFGRLIHGLIIMERGVLLRPRGLGK
jgi:hypothetical protein